MHEVMAEQVWLNGIDCLKKEQPYGTRAKRFRSEEGFGKEVTMIEVSHLSGGHIPDGQRTEDYGLTRNPCQRGSGDEHRYSVNMTQLP